MSARGRFDTDAIAEALDDRLRYLWRLNREFHARRRVHLANEVRDNELRPLFAIRRAGRRTP